MANQALSEEKKRCFEQVPARVVLYMLSWSGFLVTFMLRTDINIAIVAMVKDPKVFNKTDFKESHCIAHEQLSTGNETLQNDYGGTLDWSPAVQTYIIAASQWTYLFSQILGGWATPKFGTKRVFGYAQLATALCSLCIPWASEIHYGLIILLRNIQGLASGVTWPAMYGLVSHWFPISERSQFVSSFQGFSVGIGITYPLCGLLIAYLGWRSVFYTTGSIGVLWCIIWYFLAFDTPETHPRISLTEQQYIKANTVISSRQKNVPWAKIFTSKAVWAVAITSFGRLWLGSTLFIMGPQYMKAVLGFSIQKNGLLTGVPHICGYFASVIFCYAADKLFVKNWMSLTNVRKLFSAISQLIPGFLVVAITFLECNVEQILIVWFLVIIAKSAAFAGAMANIIDIAPNFSAPVMAFAQTIHMTASFLSSLVVGYFTKDGHTLSAWRNIFNVSAILIISTYIVYHFFGTAEIQSWNEIDSEINCTELEVLLETNDEIDESTLKNKQRKTVKQIS